MVARIILAVFLGLVFSAAVAQVAQVAESALGVPRYIVWFVGGGVFNELCIRVGL